MHIPFYAYLWLLIGLATIFGAIFVVRPFVYGVPVDVRGVRDGACPYSKGSGIGKKQVWFREGMQLGYAFQNLIPMLKRKQSRCSSLSGITNLVDDTALSIAARGLIGSSSALSRTNSRRSASRDDLSQLLVSPSSSRDMETSLSIAIERSD